MKLTKTTILKEALKIIKSQGTENLSMRVLADNLSVSPTALYRHFNNKEVMLANISVSIYEKAYQESSKADTLDQIFKVLANTLKNELLRTPGISSLVSTLHPGKLHEHRMGFNDKVSNLGVSKEVSLQATSTVIAFVLGWVTYYENVKFRNYLNKQFDFKGSFEVGLESIVRGYFG
jgi:TetR/AcrR family tetracycline transcriptional repressor